VWQLRPYVYRALDRSPTRGLLALAATWAARRESGGDVEIAFRDGLWMYRAGDTSIPGERRFVYRHGRDILGWPSFDRALAEDMWFHVYRPKRGDVIVDVGAGIGGETQVFSEDVGALGRVLSIEANPSPYERLRARVRWNRLENVTPVQCAIVDRAQPVYIEDRPEVYERNTVSLQRRDRDLPTPVEGVSLDELCRREGIDRIDFLKMNIEGAERLAVEGMTDVVGRTGAVCVACHDFSSVGDEGRRTRGPVVEFLEAAGFDIVTRPDDPRPFVRDHVHAIRR
jgi:FkbM family methyltransferase